MKKYLRGQGNVMLRKELMLDVAKQQAANKLKKPK